MSISLRPVRPGSIRSNASLPLSPTKRSDVASIEASRLCALISLPSSIITMPIQNLSDGPSPQTTSSPPSNDSAATIPKPNHYNVANFWFRTLDISAKGNHIDMKPSQIIWSTMMKAILDKHIIAQSDDISEAHGYSYF